uniref:uncharacterized protein LOC103796388 isoform X2 n=1 Tax=Callithrix jacchus TaxID=9483 RepID=UPI0023DD1E15|nr:uncharacterized protein LOC103796388 isoform X2 [Callithrix jacchus]
MPAKRHCLLSNLCLSGTGRTELPRQLSLQSCLPAPPGPVPLNSTLLQGQRAPVEALCPGTALGASSSLQKGPWWSGPLQTSPLVNLVAGLGGLGGPSPASHHPAGRSLLLQPRAPGSPLPAGTNSAGKQPRWVEQGGGQGAAGGCSLTVSAACPGLRNPPLGRTARRGMSGWAPSAAAAPIPGSPWMQPHPWQTPHAKRARWRPTGTSTLLCLSVLDGVSEAPQPHHSGAGDSRCFRQGGGAVTTHHPPTAMECGKAGLAWPSSYCLGAYGFPPAGPTCLYLDSVDGQVQRTGMDTEGPCPGQPPIKACLLP